MDVQRIKAWSPRVLVLGALGVVHGPTLVAHIARGFHANIFNDDARQQIYPFFRYADSSLFPNDYVGDYYLNCLPLGFRALYTASAPLIDPAVSSKIVAYLLLLITLAGLGVAANRIGGKVAAWAAMSLLLGASLYLDRMGGGLPRAFGFPILAWALAALAYGRTKWLAALVWLGALFYPVAGVVTGLATALLLLLLPASDRGDAEAWDLRRRLRFLALAAGVSLVLLLPTIVASSSYAPVITSDDLAEYPEAGPGGRYGTDSRAPYDSFAESAATAVWRGVRGAGGPWVEPIGAWAADRAPAILIFVAAFSALGWLLFLASSGVARRAMMLGLAAFIGYWLARFAPPYLYLPSRYADYSVPVLAVLMISTSVPAFYSMRDKLGWADAHVGATKSFRAGVTLVFCLFVLLTIGGRGSATAGLNVEADDTALYEAVASLPVDAVIAGWPRTAIENVPYVARRTALVTFETHQAFHQEYADVMRERMRAEIDAWLATSDDPLIRLRDEHGVTHMLVYLPHLRGKRLEYFRPFNAWIAEAGREGAGKLPALQALVDNHATYRDERYALVDLRGLSGPL
jgi:hypothetical protein